MAVRRLHNPDILELLEEGEAFANTITNEYFDVCCSWGFVPLVSEWRLLEARNFWLEDTGRMLRENMPEGTTALDHFKHAAFITFWLRRLVPINELMKVDGAGPLTPDALQFVRYANEMCALHVGFQICLGFELARKIDLSPNINVIHATEDLAMASELVRDTVVYLKHKNVSPHALYLQFRSLFSTLHADRKG
ncbi:MAG: hypothetical protein ABL864_04120 [Terricaulis sp.]